MGTETLPDNTTVAAGLIIKSADFLTTNAALQAALVPRNTSGVPTSGQSLGTILYPWGTVFCTALSIGGTVVDLSGITSPANRIVSGAVRTTSGQPQFLQANGAAASVDILGLTTNLVLTINSSAVTVSTDITKASLTTAPGTNNTCLINDTTFTDQAESKYYGESDSAVPKITIDNVGSEISARVGQYISLKTDTNEIMFGWLKSATELVNVRRGFFFDSSLAPIVRETLINNETLTLMETGWIFVENDGLTVDVTYKTPVYAYTAPTSPVASQYWYDITNATWKRYSGSAFVDVGRILVGLCVQNTSNCIATRSFDFYKDFDDVNTIQADVFSDEVIRSRYETNTVNVYGTELVFENYPVIWNNTTNMETGSIGNDTEYYLYLDTLGKPVISLERPYDRRSDLRGRYHPYNNWRFICKAKTDGAADWINVISSGGVNGTFTGLNFDAGGLLINATGIDTVTVKYNWLTIRNAAGEEKTVYNGNHTLTFSNHLQGAELASTWYSLWVDWDLNFKFVPDIEGATDGTTAGFLVDSGNAFATYTVFKNAIVYNTTDYNETYVTVSATSDTANLALNDDNFTTTETYKIHMLDPVGLGEGRAHIGYVENNAGSDLSLNSGYTRPELQSVQSYSSPNDFTVTAANWTTTAASIRLRQFFDFGLTPIWEAVLNIYGSHSNSVASFSVTISGITFDSDYTRQAVAADPGTGSGSLQLQYATGNSGTLSVAHTTANNGTISWSGAARCLVKPSFATRS